MTISANDFIERVQIDQQTLEIWIEEEWVIPSRSTRELAFSEADVARAALIRDLKDELGVNEEGVGVVLNLLDQVHGLRTALAHALRSLHERSPANDMRGHDKDAG